MIHTRSRVNDHIFSQRAPRLHNGSCHDLNTLVEMYVRSEDS